MATIGSNLEIIGKAYLRDGNWAREQLDILTKQDGWITTETEVIEAEKLGGIGRLKGFFEQENAFLGGRAAQSRTGYKLVTDDDYNWTPTSGAELCGTIAEEIHSRAGNGEFDWQNIKFLIPGIDDGTAKNIVQCLKLRKLAQADPVDKTILRIATREKIN